MLSKVSLLEYNQKDFNSSLLDYVRDDESIKDRFEYFCGVIDGLSFKGMDLLSFIQFVKRDVFYGEELEKNIDIVYICDKKFHGKVTIMLVFNEDDIKSNSGNNYYFLKEYGKKICRIKKSDLVNMIKEGRLIKVKGSRADSFGSLKREVRK